MAKASSSLSAMMMDNNKVEEEDEEERASTAAPTNTNGSDTYGVLDPPPFGMDERVFCLDSKNNNTKSCFYPAVIRKTKRNFEDHSWTFLVHYLGWNSRWDRWTSASDILPDTKENQLIYQQQQAQASSSSATTPDASATCAGSQSNNNKRKSTATTGGDDATTSSRKKSFSSTIAQQKQQSSIMAYYQDYCELPLTLKTVLVEEWEKITRRGWNSPHGYDDDYFFDDDSSANSTTESSATSSSSSSYPARVVHDLPAKVTIRHVLNHFSKTRLEKIQKLQQKQQQQTTSAEDNNSNTVAATTESASTLTVDKLQEFCQGLIQLFQQALPVCLLYPQERPQYEHLMQHHHHHHQQTQQQQQQSQQRDDNTNNKNNNKQLLLVDIYGCEFLLRLLVRLPLLMQQSPLLSSSSSQHASSSWVGPLLADLIVLLQRNRQAIFKGQFRTPAYQQGEWLEWEQSQLLRNRLPKPPNNNKPPLVARAKKQQQLQQRLERMDMTTTQSSVEQMDYTTTTLS